MPSSLPSDGGEPDLTPMVHAARDGDEEAFVVLFRAIQPGLLRYLWAHIGDAAEDVAAETWLRVARDLRRFDGDEAGFRAWVTTIGRHRMLDYLRQQGRQPTGGAPEEMLALLPAADNTEQAVADALGTANALSLIASLPAGQAEAILLTVVMELDAKTAGKILGKRPGAIRVAAHRGLRKLADMLGGAATATARDVTARHATAPGFTALGVTALGVTAPGDSVPGRRGRRFASRAGVTPVTGVTVKDMR